MKQYRYQMIKLIIPLSSCVSTVTKNLCSIFGCPKNQTTLIVDEEAESIRALFQFGHCLAKKAMFSTMLGVRFVDDLSYLYF